MSYHHLVTFLWPWYASIPQTDFPKGKLQLAPIWNSNQNLTVSLEPNFHIFTLTLTLLVVVMVGDDGDGDE